MIVDYSQQPLSDVLWFVVSNSTNVSQLCFFVARVASYLIVTIIFHKCGRSGLGMSVECSRYKY
jgi:hypothetical protein